MIVIADTSPVNYLVLLNEVALLEQLFGQVVIPEAVHSELMDEHAPQVVKDWLGTNPSWLEVKRIKVPADKSLERLGRGEREAIVLAQVLNADLLLIDERFGYEIAVQRKIRAAGTIFVLEQAAVRGLVNLSQAIARLRQTSFRVSDKLLQVILDRHNAGKIKE